MQHLLDSGVKGPFLKSFLSPEIVFNRFSEALERLVPASNLRGILGRLVVTTNRFFSAERGGFFLMKKELKMGRPELIAAVNLTEFEVNSNKFKAHHKLISEALLNNRAVITKPSAAEKKGAPQALLAALCLPINMGDRGQAVLYHDNSLLNDGFDALDDHTLALLKTHLEAICRQIWNYVHSTQRKIRQASEKEIETKNTLKEKIIGESPVIQELLEQVQRIASTESPILIQGETGAGKEILAR